MPLACHLPVPLPQYGPLNWTYTLSGSPQPTFTTAPHIISSYSASFLNSASKVQYNCIGTPESTTWANTQFTVEWWQYTSSSQNIPTLFQLGTEPGVVSAEFGSAGSYMLGSFALCGAAKNTPTQQYYPGTWYNIAIVRLDANNFKVYVNGVLRALETLSSPVNFDPTTMALNGYYGVDGNYGQVGYMDQMRISTVARYTGGSAEGQTVYTPQTTPFQADAQTWFLCNFENTFQPTTQ